MREISYKNLTSVKNRRRVISISEKSRNRECITRVQRIFIYIVGKNVDAIEELSQPVFHITKPYNTKTKEENFFFRVKGAFYITKHDKFLLVNFCHSLRIDILRKSKVSA